MRRRRTNLAEPLLVTERQREHARGRGTVAFWRVPARDFLALTLGRREAPEFCKTAHPIEHYNGYTQRGEEVMMPFLRIRREDGGVTTHEGRHRACALLRSEGPQAVMDVALTLDTGTWARAKPYEERMDVKGVRWRRYLGPADLPCVLQGQFSDVRVPLRAGRLMRAWRRDWHRARGVVT